MVEKKCKIEKIKEILSNKAIYKKGRGEILLYHLYDYVSNLKIPGEIEHGYLVDSLFGNLTNGLTENKLLEDRLLAITPIKIRKLSRASKIERVFDLYFDRVFQTIFLDLDKKTLSIGCSRSSGSRGTYDTLSVIFEKAKSPTLIPLFVGKELLKVNIFPRYIGASHYHGQWCKEFPEELKEKGYDTVSHVMSQDLLNSDKKVSVWLEPEKKEKFLLKLY